MNVARTLVHVNLHLSNKWGKANSKLEYSRIIESLIYLMSCTRSIIAYLVSRLSRYMNNLGIMIIERQEKGYYAI